MLDPDEWHALSPHLDKALEMNDEERSIWLSWLHSRDPEVALQLEALLYEHRVLAEEGILERRSVELPSASTLADQTVGVYRLLSQVGHGGMSSVWLAERADGRFERQVGVKFLNIALMGKVGEERFKAADARLTFCACVDRNGYLPVHNAIYSKPQRTGDLAWNTANSACGSALGRLTPS